MLNFYARDFIGTVESLQRIEEDALSMVGTGQMGQMKLSSRCSMN